jgi:hypothetical protein
VGGNGHGGSSRASVVTTNGNIHIDATTSNGVYFGWYNSGTSGVYFGNGASGQVGRIDGAGNASFSGSVSGSVINGSSSVTGLEVYSNNWFRNNTSNTGLYNTSTTQHWSSQTNGYWDASSTASVSAIRFYTGSHIGALRGYVYADSSNNIGFLNQNGNWRLRVVEGDYILVDGSSVRAPLYYDSTNTNFYVDPASVSALNNLIVAPAAVSNNNNGLRNVMPGGGSYVTGASSVSGAIVITLPETVFPMIRFTVRVYTYDGLSFDIYCGGHTSGGSWYNTFAYMGTQNRPALNVRFTYGGGLMYVYIGELGSSWSYPQVFITDVQVGYTNYEYNRWDDGWSIGFNSSTYNNIVITHAVYPPPSTANNTNDIYASRYYDANSTGYYVDPASQSQMNVVSGFYCETYPGDGHGFRFWQNDAYKISMGVSSLYQYGPVTDYSIKMNMDNGSPGRGFTWGTQSNVPVAALNGTSGNFQIAGYMGLATTPSTLWSSAWKAVQMAGSASVAGAQFSVFRAAALSVNAAGSGTSPLTNNYIEASRAGTFLIVPSSGTTSCTFYWRGATVGTAGAAITWNTPMILDSNGYLLVGYGGSNGAYNLQVNSQIFATSSTIATSDGRYKENVESLDGALDLVKALRPVQFNWKKHSVHNFDTNTPTIGFIAQEVQQVLADKPYLNSIVKRNDCVLEAEEKDEDENVIKEAVTEEFFGIAEGNLIALLTRAMQEQNAEVVDLRSRIATLEALVLNLTGK